MIDSGLLEENVLEAVSGGWPYEFAPGAQRTLKRVYHTVVVCVFPTTENPYPELRGARDPEGCDSGL